MTFSGASLLWLLILVLPALGLFLWWSARVRRRLITRFISARLMPALVAGLSPRRETFRNVLIVAAIGSLIVALAGPQWGYQLEEVQQRGLDIVVAVDTSRSMLAEDIAPNRLTRAKYAALDLMRQARSDRLGLVAFSGTAFLQCPLTIDDSAFRRSVEFLDTTTLPQGGTALAEAIRIAQTAFKEGDNHKVLVLFTDGEDHDSSAIEAAERAAAAGMKIFTIGLGSTEGELLRIKGAQGQADYVRDPEGNVVKSRLNEDLLRRIATVGNGFYLPLRGAKVVETLYEKGLAPLPKSESQEKWVRRPRERYHWPLALSLVLLVIEMLFPERKREKRKSSSTATAKVSAAVVGLICFMPMGGAASPAGALRHYEAGRYAEALAEYERSLQKNTNDARLQFNAGVAAFRGQQLEKAENYFEQVLTAPDLELQQRAYYNLGNTFYRLGEQQSDPTRRSPLWEQAIQRYESSLKLDPADTDAKFNLEFVRRKLEELKQQQEQQSQDSKPPEPSPEARAAKARADEAVRRRDYKTALEIMETQLKKDPTTSAYSDYIERLKGITGVTQAPRP
jgi:Ca-activated chloride channel family protein